MDTHGVKLDTLKECFEFLDWLNGPKGQKSNVVTELVQRLTPSFPKMPSFKRGLHVQYVNFLNNVSALRTKLLSNKITTPSNYVNTRDKTQILDALLGCIPKFLAALYYLQYHVDDAFSNVGGGDWASQSLQRGELCNFLTTGNNILRGGFSVHEVNNIEGRAVANELRKILNKEVDTRTKNPVHDHFRNVTLTISNKPWHAVNTGNTVSLVNVFCVLVAGEKDADGGAFKAALEKGLGKKICWQDLKNHCQLLKEHIDTLTGAGFSVTGRGITPTHAVNFAKTSATWFRANLPKAAGELSEMIPQSINSQKTELQSFANDKLYPRGFIFDGSKPNVLKRGLPQQWTLNLQRFNELESKLIQLKAILEGEYTASCPNLAPPPVTSSEAPKAVAPERKSARESTSTKPAVKTEAAKPVVSQSKVTPNQSQKSEGAQNQAKKVEGAQNQGKKAERNQNQTKAQSGRNPSSSSATTSSPSPSTGVKGAPGPAGPQGGKGTQGPTSTGSTTSSSSQNTVTSQHTPPQPPANPPPRADPSTPAGPVSSSKPGSGGGSANGGAAQGSHTAGASQPLPPKSSSALSPRSSSSSVSGNNGGPGPSSAPGQPGGQSKGSQSGAPSLTGQSQNPSISSSGTPSHGVPSTGSGKVSASVPGQQGGTSKGPNDGSPTAQQPGAPAQNVTTQPSSDSSPVPPSSSVPAPVGGQGTGDQGSTFSTTQQNGQGTSPSSTTAATTATTGSGGGGGGAGGVGGSNGKGVGQDPALVKQHSPTCPANQIKSVDMSGTSFCRPKPNKSYRKPLSENAENKIANAYEKTVVKNILNDRNTKHPNRKIPQFQIPPNRPTPTSPVAPGPSRPIHPTPSVQPSRLAPGPYPLPPGSRDGQGRRYYEPAEGRGRHDDGSMAVNQPSEFDGQPIPDTASKELQEKIKKKVEGIKFLKSLESTAQQEEVEQLRRDEETVNTEQEKKAKAEWEKRKQQGKGVKKHDEDLDRIQKTLQRSNRANEARLRQEEEQRKFIEAAPQLDGSQPTDDAYGEHWPWWYPGLLYREITGKPIDDDLPERLQDQRDRLFHEKIQDDLGRHIDERKALQTLERKEKDQIKKHNKDAEEELRRGRIQHMQLNPPITTVLPALPDPRELPDSLKHPDITFKVVDSTDRQSFAQKSKDAAQRIKDHYEKQRQRVADEKKVYKEELEQKEKNATQAHVESIKRAGEIVQSEHLKKMFHGGDFDIALAPSLNVDDFEDNAHEAYRIYGPSPKKTSDEIFEYNPKWNNVINYGLIVDPNPNMCNNPWNYAHDSATSSTLPLPPDSDHLPPPTNVKAMLFWLVGLNAYGLIAKMERHIEGLLMVFNGDTFYPKYALQVNGDLSSLSASHIADTLTEACLYSAHVLNGIMRMQSGDALSDIDFKLEYDKLHYSPDPACLLCQLRDYVYACCHQLAFLKAQCKRGKSLGGWQDSKYGSDIKTSSPLQAFLTDGWDSDFETHPFDPCNLCLKSRVRMGFRDKDLPKTSQQGSVISAILTPSCGGSDPLLTLASYLNCLTRRTPRTTGELVSYFHHFGNELHEYALKALSSLGTAITKSHADCPDWDCLGASDLQAVSGLRGSEALNMISNNNHDNEHPKTLSTLVGCGSDFANCRPHCPPITYRAYALYSQSFVHTYLSWTVYLPDRLRESLEKLHYELKKHDFAKCTSLHLCSTALPLLYTHGFTPPEGKSQSTVKCYDVMSKLKEIVDGKPIASLMTAMDDFLYGIREPFIYTIVALWSLAFLVFANTMLYRLDVLRIRSHLIRTKASHHIDVKALLTKGRKMLSLYKDVDYFDEDPIGYLGVTH
ncbi:hypothetical protein BBBOND_0308600 [Babesia bigemina]|uniref:Ribosome-binding protein 1 n=1 Tax=Babesia bigemina TaxID=5866 RepID=A0A061D8D0_BABBI|nr:hypothetical protein BBBOND_0308540 [Babesia bigemina]XP_012769143.1 hypothetical protein BBBOND_0308600 [Babesia bigemina]CDR96951.1 hypothetical protein BBBOND_0308540 [Babesia bigemina]CDR96957.1 hypothetical protein BBBOND_0308600 [Babesia bigemina]|eukprot:XP_012769137.1 hypothetical protein BBBOND_0308540 [Babesia bigemina]